MAKITSLASSVLLLCALGGASSFGAQTQPSNLKQTQDRIQEMDIISMSQSADEFVPAPNHESFLSAEELQELRRRSPAQWDIQVSGKPLEIPNFLKTALDSETDTQSE